MLEPRGQIWPQLWVGGNGGNGLELCARLGWGDAEQVEVVSLFVGSMEKLGYIRVPLWGAGTSQLLIAPTWSSTIPSFELGTPTDF